MTATPTPSPEAEALPTLPVVAEEDTFEVWFEQYRMQTWLSAGCHKDRGPEPSAAWGLGSRQSLLRGWLARAALSHAPAEAAIVALRAEVERLNLLVMQGADGRAEAAHAELYYRQAEKLLTANERTLHAEVAELRSIIRDTDLLLTNLQPHIPQACYPGRAAFIDNYVEPALEKLRSALPEWKARASLLGDGGTL